METLHAVVAVLAASVLLAGVAEWLKVPHSVTLVTGGAALALVPDLPPIHVDGELLLALVLPITMYPAALFTSWRALRTNLVPISSLAVGLVLATTLAVGVAVRWIDPAIPWAVAFLIGAIVAPPDASAALDILARLGVRQRIRTILEGESLVNDPAALVLYQVAVAAVVSGTFAAGEVAGGFAVDAAGGIAIGVGLAMLASVAQARVSGTLVAVTLSVLVAYGSYLAAEAAGLSGVIAIVAAGIVRGRWASAHLRADVRLVDSPFWDVLSFVASSFVFVLIGLELPGLVSRLGETGSAEFALFAAAIIAVIGGLRFAWIVANGLARRGVAQAAHQGALDPPLSWQGVAVVGWSGMRGIVSIAAALALPHTVASGAPFPGRDAIIVLVSIVVFVTIVVPGLTLAPLARVLRVADDPVIGDERRLARDQMLAAVQVALRKLAAEGAITEESASAVEASYRDRTLRAEPDGAAKWKQTPRYRALLAASQAARARLLALYAEGKIGNTVRRELEREMDLEESRLGE